MKIVDQRNTGFKQQIIIDEIKDADIRGRNFSGIEKRNPRTGTVVNSAGRRNFLLKLSEDVAAVLASFGCDVQYTVPRDDNDVPYPYVPINVSYYLKDRGIQPEVHLISNGVDSPLDEGSINTLDNVELTNLCLVLSVSNKEKEHKNGDTYHAIFADEIWAQVTPKFVPSWYAYPPTPVPAADDIDGPLPF